MFSRKEYQESIPKQEQQIEMDLDIVHSDVCKPISATSLSGYVYYVSLIDDYSHKTCEYFLKGKDEVFGKFMEFKVLVENLLENKIKTLRSENGG